MPKLDLRAFQALSKENFPTEEGFAVNGFRKIPTQGEFEMFRAELRYAGRLFEIRLSRQGEQWEADAYEEKALRASARQLPAGQRTGGRPEPTIALFDLARDFRAKLVRSNASWP